MSLGARLEAYEALVRSWAPRIDLISPGDLDRLGRRHIEDSLKALPLVASAPVGPCVDVGSGAGFPGIPLALAEPARHWRLLEPRAKRAAFLEEVVRSLELDCEVLALSAAQAVADPGLAGSHALATARALAAPARAFELLRPLCMSGGLGVVWSGKDAVVPPDAGEVVPGLASLTF